MTISWYEVAGLLGVIAITGVLEVFTERRKQKQRQHQREELARRVAEWERSDRARSERLRHRWIEISEAWKYPTNCMPSSTPSSRKSSPAYWKEWDEAEKGRLK